MPTGEECIGCCEIAQVIDKLEGTGACSMYNRAFKGLCGLLKYVGVTNCILLI